MVENASLQFFLWAQALITNLSSMFHARHDPLIHKCFFRNLIFRRAREYFRTASVLTSFAPAPMSFDATLAFIILHLKSNIFFLFILEDYEPNQDIELSSYYFKLTFQHMPNLFASGPFGMVIKHLENSINGFPQFFQLCFHIAQGHIPFHIKLHISLGQFTS